MSGTRISSLLGIALIVIVGCSLSAYGKYGGGSGTAGDPYQIKDANHMQAIGADANDWDRCFKLMADIDLSGFKGTSFNIIGTDSNHRFSGVFDGNNHTIASFTYDSNDKSHIGLFGYVFYAEIKDLGLLEANVNAGTGGNVGSLIGFGGRITLTNCYVKGGIITGYSRVGGLVGCCYGSSTISNCYSYCNVVGITSVGGLVGYTFIGSSIISNCYATGSVDGNDRIGGLVGHNIITVTNCYATSSVDGNDYVGGLVGSNGGIITNSYWNLETSNEPNMCGNWPPCDNSYGKTTAEMHQQSTFTDWDFINTWNIGENQTYPYLRVYLAGDINKDGITNFLDLSILCNQWMNKE